MARIYFDGASEYAKKLEQLQDAYSARKIQEKAVAAGAEIVADEIRNNIRSLPSEKFHHLADGESFDGIPEGQKRDLLESFGLTPISTDKNGFLHTKAGFDGYGSFPTKEYPKGLPNQMVARVTESGSSVRQKHPFVRPAVRATKDPAVKKMDSIINEETEKIMKNGG